MFKRFITFMAAAVAAVSMVSCDNDDSKPTIEFSKTLYTVYQKGAVDVDVVVSGPAETDLTVPLTFIGNAEKGVDYTASAESVVIKAGESSGSVTITNVSLSEEKQVSLGFTVPEGYSMGTKIVAVIAPSSQEALVYSFSMTKFDALEGCLATVNVVGTLTGKDFKADEDIYVPLAVSGEGASKLSFTDEGTTSTSSVSAKPGVFALIHAGESSGVAKFKVEDGFSGDLKAEISVNEEADSRFIAGDNSKMEVAVKGLQTPDKLVGTWKFSKVFSKDEMDMWFMEYEDDPEALPTHNEGFTLTFAKESDGTVSLTPGGKGDFLNFFRKATVTLGEPKNMVAKGVVLGAHSTSEGQMFIAADETNGCAYQSDTYYKLSSANRAFSATKETLGEATVVFRLSDDGLTLEFRDYDKPPFGEMWADEWTKFDPDMFGFASLFVKQ